MKLAGLSVIRFARLITSRSLHQPRNRVGEIYTVGNGGYKVFRETVCENVIPDARAVLTVGFRLRLIRSNPILHWMFQRVCILTTPFWSGFRGFHIKLWMVDPRTKNYLGIYDWAGKENALIYVNALVRVLRPLSTAGSVWYELYPNQNFDSYLDVRRQSPQLLRKGLVAHA